MVIIYHVRHSIEHFNVISKVIPLIKYITVSHTEVSIKDFDQYKYVIKHNLYCNYFTIHDVKPSKLYKWVK